MKVAIQRGHCFRTRGATGTSGHRGTEQQFANLLAHACERVMENRGHQVEVLTADEPVPKADVFLAFHQDGSSSPSAHGASVGYQTATSKAYAQTWKAEYQAAGWPRGFRADNYTAALRNYYGFRKASSPVEVIFEHGFATNRADEDWMWDHVEDIARAHADTLDLHAGTEPGDEDDMSAEAEKQIQAMYDRIVIGAPQYAVPPMWETATETWQQVLGTAEGNNLRRFIQDQDKRTRELTAAGLTKLWEQIETLANEGSPGGPINVTVADRAAIARAVALLFSEQLGNGL